MTTNAMRGALALGLAVLLCACDLDPTPIETRQVGYVAQVVSLRGQNVPGDEYRWGFTSRPVGDVGAFRSVLLETAEFVPGAPGEYVIDRWVGAGPAAVWTDRFVVDVEGDFAELGIDGPEEIRLGQTREYQVNQVIGVFAFNWALSRPTSTASSYQELEPGTEGKATFTPEIAGSYLLSCLVVYESGTTDTTTLRVRVLEAQ